MPQTNSALGISTEKGASSAPFVYSVIRANERNNIGQAGTLLIEADASYFRGKDERTQAINLEPQSIDVIYDVWAPQAGYSIGADLSAGASAQADNIGQVKCNSGSYSYYYYLKDHLGDVRMTLDSSGAVDSYNNYYPFGEQMPGTGMNLSGSSDGRYKYVSVEQDAEPGLYDMGARYYDPWSGRFFSVDTLASDSALAPWSPYQYSFDNPVTLKDPTGKWPGLASTIATAFAEWAYNEVYSARNTIVNSMDYTGNSSTSNSPDVQAQSEGAGPIAMATTPASLSKLQMNVLSNYMCAEAIGSAGAAAVVLSAGGAGFAFEGLAVPSLAISLGGTGASALSDYVSSSRVSILTEIGGGVGVASLLVKSTAVTGSLGLISTGLSVYSLFNSASQNRWSGQ